MLNKAQVIKEYLKFVSIAGGDASKVALTAGAALVVFGLREQTEDLDLWVRPEAMAEYELHRQSLDFLADDSRLLYDVKVAYNQKFQPNQIATGIFIYTLPASALLEHKILLSNLPDRSPEKLTQDKIDIDKLMNHIERSKRLTASPRNTVLEVHLVAGSRLFAMAAHEAIGQKRNYTGEPYFTHPEAVAAIVESVPHTQVMLAVSHLHDILEDTSVRSETLRKEFGDEVADAVLALTDTPVVEGINRAARKSIDRVRLSKATPDVKTIKLADLIDNAEDIIANGGGFAPTFISEVELLLPCLIEGDATLHARATAIVAAYRSNK